MPQKEQPESEDSFYVEIREHYSTRRDILETLKDLVQSMRRFERHKETRKQKLAKIEQLRSNIKEISKLMPKLKAALPQSKVRAKPLVKEILRKQRSHKRKAEKKQLKKAAKTGKGAKRAQSAGVAPNLAGAPMNEIQKLEAELSAIERKLDSL